MTALGLRKKIALSFLIIFAIWFLGLLWFTQQIPHSKSEIPQNSANAIVVLTGGSGRLEYALQLLAEKKAETLFVSGVGEKVTIADIIRQAPENIRGKLSANKIILGRQAENTIGNALEIKQWLMDTNYKKIILVTSSYHVPRSLLEFSTLLPDVSITIAPVIAADNDLSFSEYHKYLASKLRHLLVSVMKK
jgi:uncharacterized SAM-binding protein YcdF (DUF218 family)